MRLTTLAALSICAASLAAEPRRQVATHAAGCTTTRVQCNSVTLGELAQGDCTTTAGNFFDVVEFQASPGKLAAVAVRPLAPTFTNVGAFIVAPAGDASRPPGVFGGHHAEVWAQITSSGLWRTQITSTDLFARGSYAVHVDCFPDDAPELPVGCVAQYLTCGQTGEWQIDAGSCRSNDNRGFAIWWMYGAAGDTLRYDMRAAGFGPLFAIYDDDAKMLKTSTNDGARRAVMTFTIPAEGWYQVLTTSRASGEGGDYQISVECVASGCLFPYIREDATSREVPYGTRPVIAAGIDAYGASPVTLELIDAATGTTLASSTTSAVLAPGITARRAFFLRASNACGSWDGEVFALSPHAMPRRRTVRH